MTSYDRFAPYYDAFYEPIVDYEGDVEYLETVFAAHSRVPVKRVLDLGSGTGAHAARLASKGYHVHGVELSDAQVAIARAKVPPARFDVGDFTRALPDGPFDAAVSMFAAWCYATGDEAAGRTLDLLRARLPPGGLFVFESWSPYGFEPAHNWGEAQLADGRRLVRLTRPRFPIRDDVYRFAMEHFVMRGETLEDHFVEEHALRLRTPYETQRLVEKHGFEVAAFTNGERDGKSLDAPRPDAMRVMCIARRAG